jgi:hypothetical protein
METKAKLNRKRIVSINNQTVNTIFTTQKILNSLAKMTRKTSLNVSFPKLVQIQNLNTKFKNFKESESGDVPGWVLVVLMTTGLVTGIWTVAQPRLSSILKNSLDNMNSIR